MIISVDTGNKQIKTVHRIFSAGLVESDSYPPFGSDVLSYRGKYYTISGDRIPYMRDKTRDLRYFVLTLFAIAYELQQAGADLDDLHEIKLLIGLPPAHFGKMRRCYEQYYLSNGREVEFEFNGRPVGVSITEVCTYPQAFAAVTPVIAEVRRFPKAMIIDIGGYTADLLQLNSGMPDLSVCESLEYGTIKFYNLVRSKVNADFDTLLDEQDIDNVLAGCETPLSDAIVSLVIRMAGQYVGDFFHHLREMEIDLKTYHTLFVGGGCILFRPFMEESAAIGAHTFITEISANARGYEKLYAASRR